MEHRFGSHSIRIEGDTVFIVIGPDCSPEHLQNILQTIETVGGGQGMVYVIADVRNMKNVPPATRRVASEWKGIGRIGGTAILGATVLTRTIVTLVSRASTLLAHTKKLGELNFCKSEEEGRAWLATRRSSDLTAAATSSSSLRIPRG